VLLKKIKREP